MVKLVLHPTEMAQWYALVSEAQEKRTYCLGTDLESYLVFLLMRFSQKPELASSVIAIDFLQGSHKSRVHRAEALQEVGDKSLLFCGLFPGLAEKRQVRLDYFVTLGRSAYASVAEDEHSMASTLFSALCQDFVSLVDTLQAMRLLPSDCDDLNRMAALGFNPLQWSKMGEGDDAFK